MKLRGILSGRLYQFLIGMVITGNVHGQAIAPDAGTHSSTAEKTVAAQENDRVFIDNLFARDTGTITIYKTWNIHFNKPASYKVPRLYTLAGSDTVPVSSSTATWTSGNASIASIANNVLTANSSGSTFITASLDGKSVSIPLKVNADIKPLEYESGIDPFLSRPANGFTNLIPVVVICYIPTNDGVNVNTAEAGFAPIGGQTIANLKKHIEKISKHTKHSLEEGSKFRGYKNPAAVHYVGYTVIDYIYVYEPVPRGYNDPASTAFFSDYNNIVNRFNGKKYVDTLGVKEFWLMGYHQGEIVPAESNMSSPTTGDISNSYRFTDDLPVYTKTYILYNYNYTREGNEATHNHGHQIETMVDYVALKQDRNTNLFTRNFRGYGNGTGPIGRCGDTHHPPNTQVDYDYYNYTSVASDIMDWKPEGGLKTLVNANTWGSINYNWPAGTTPNVESNWYVFWMQSLPGYSNQIPYNTKWMSNWWQFLSNWDSTTAKTGLYQDNVALPVKLGAFEAFNRGNVNELKWQMTREETTSHIEIERSPDGQNYAVIDHVSAVSSPTVQHYAFTDRMPLEGSNYYRLKIMDKSGTFLYSEVVMIKVHAAISIRVSPNPANSMITISGLATGRENVLQLINNTGSTVCFVKTTGAEATIDIHQLPAGAYILKISFDGKTFSRKVMKQ